MKIYFIISLWILNKHQAHFFPQIVAQIRSCGPFIFSKYLLKNNGSIGHFFTNYTFVEAKNMDQKQMACTLNDVDRLA